VSRPASPARPVPPERRDDHRYTGPLGAVILDWAGTTVDYGCFAPTAVFLEVFRRRGIELTIEQARGPMGAQKRDHIAAIAAMEPVARAWRERHGRPCGGEDVDSMYEEFIPLQLACLADHADIIPGTLEAVAEFRRRGLKVGTTTGYNTEMMDILVPEARKRGYEPDSIVSPSDVPAGRPQPWMCYQNAINLQVYPMEAFVKVGDTVPDIEEGLNAGMWTVGVARTGNEMGLTEAEVEALPAAELESRLAAARDKLFAAGAHYVVDGIGDLPGLLDEIEARLAGGERP
jgi:phosphonoacetaldehyde hydrolase